MKKHPHADATDAVRFKCSSNSFARYKFDLIRLPLVVIISIATCFISTTPALSQKKKSEVSPAASQDAIASKVSGMKQFPGFISFYYDEKKDKIYLTIEKFSEELLYVRSLTAGVGSNDLGLDRGQIGGVHVVKFDRRGSKVLLVEPNYMYRAITESKDERRAVQEAFAQSVLWGFSIEAESNGKVLVDATSFFLRDAHGVAQRLRDEKQGDYRLDDQRSALFQEGTKNFPKNSEFEAILTFTGNPQGEFIRSVVPSPESVTVRQHHSFVELPDNQYKPRKYDPRSGYFGISYFDYATPISEPIEKRFIARHRLEKKDPTATISDPVKPIVYYLDRGTPEPIRSALLDGARWWNQAFESAGYRNAFIVEMMPEDADPMDVRYNVIQWVHRSTRGWSYGASVTDPRTGEIIKGHVTLGSLRVRQDFLIAEGLLAPYANEQVPPEMQEMALARLRQLSAHEVGHTLGLAHAYSASAEHNASVMDYPHPYVAIQDGKLSLQQAYDNKIGAWDKVSIQFGYQDFADGTDEKSALNTIISKSLSDGLTFLSDQDARPRGGAHPFAHLWDNGNDAATELDRVLEIRGIALRNFGEKNIRPGAPWATLEEVLVPMYYFHRYQTEATAKVVGGLNYRYALRGDSQPVTELITPESQDRALSVLLKTLSPETLALPEKILQNIPPRPMFYDPHRELISGRTDLTFDGLAAAENAASLTIGLLLHPARAARLYEHHARDPKQPSLESVIDRIATSTTKSAPLKGYGAAVQITTSDVFIGQLLELSRDQDASQQVRSIALFKANQLKLWLTKQADLASDEQWKAHYTASADLIRKNQDGQESLRRSKDVKIPPGQPIGQFDEDYCSQR
ncbi:MAG: zinc-dependent metalloprotease [Chryseolinea sp.]